MSLEPVEVTNWACEECGADVGQECLPGCPLRLQAHEEKFMGDPDWELTGIRPIEESLGIIASVMHMLPYNSLVGPRGMGAPELRDYDTEGYLDRLADWLTEYLPLAQAQVDELQAQSRQRISMQLERDVLDGVIRRALEGTSA